MNAQFTPATKRWRIYYGDGSTVDSASHSPFDVQAFDVQAIILEDPDTGRLVMTGHDYYWWRDGEWYACMDSQGAGLWDYIMHTTGPIKILLGRTLGNRIYDEIVQRAINDSDFPAKSATKPHRET